MRRRRAEQRRSAFCIIDSCCNATPCGRSNNYSWAPRHIWTAMLKRTSLGGSGVQTCYRCAVPRAMSRYRISGRKKKKRRPSRTRAGGCRDRERESEQLRRHLRTTCMPNGTAAVLGRAGEKEERLARVWSANRVAPFHSGRHTVWQLEAEQIEVFARWEVFRKRWTTGRRWQYSQVSRKRVRTYLALESLDPEYAQPVRRFTGKGQGQRLGYGKRNATFLRQLARHARNDLQTLDPLVTAFLASRPLCCRLRLACTSFLGGRGTAK